MYDVSEEFKVAVRYSHQIITKAEVLRDGQVIDEIYPESGSVEIDARRAQRRTCELSLHAGGRSISYSPTYATYAALTTAYATYTALKTAVAIYGDTVVVSGEVATEVDDGLVPDTGLDLLTPFGNEVKLYRGIRYQKAGAYTYAMLSAGYATYTALKAAVASYDALGATTVGVTTVDEYAPLGVFGITNVGINQDTSGVELAISGIDRSLRISRNRWRDPYQIADGTNVADALTALLQDRWVDIPLKFDTTTATTTAVTLGIDGDSDPWADAVAIAEAAGLDLFFDADGYCVLQAVPDYSVAAAVEKYNEDDEAMLLTTNRTLSSEGVYNTVVVTAEGTSTDIPYRSTAYDDNPASPTYVYGPFGFSPTFVSTPLINSQAEADAYATAQLSRVRGTDEEIQWSQIVDPSLDAGDVVAVVNVAAKLARAIVIDRLTVPLAAEEPMNAQGRTIVYQTGDAVVTSSGQVVTVYAKDTSNTGAGTTEGGLIRTSSVR